MRAVSKFLVMASVWATFFSAAGQDPAHAQNLLERLENKLNQVLGPLDGGPEGAERHRPVGRAPGYLGLRCENDEDLNTVVVREVVPGSPAERAGFQVDDEVIALNNKNIRRMDEMSVVLDNAPPGTLVEFEIRRDGRRQRIQATLAQRVGFAAPPFYDRRAYDDQRVIPRSGTYTPPAYAPNYAPGTYPPATQAPGGYVARPADRPSLGITVAPVSDEAKARYALTVRRGALITALRQGGTAERYGLPVGAAIVAFNGQRIDSPDDLIVAVQGSRVGEEVELTYYDADKMFRKKIAMGASNDVALEPRFRPDGTLEPPLVMAPGRSSNSGSLDRLEGTLDRSPSGAVAVMKPATSDEVLTMRKQMDTMQRQIEELQRRIKDLEARASGTLPPPANP